MTSPEARKRYRESPKGRAARAAAQAARNAPHAARLSVARAWGCADCGSHDDLHFHHVDPSTKTRDVASMRNASDAAVAAEIAKCVVVCRSCHRLRHNRA